MFPKVWQIPSFTRSKQATNRSLSSWTKKLIPSSVQTRLGTRCFRELPVARVPSSVRTSFGIIGTFLPVQIGKWLNSNWLRQIFVTDFISVFY